jgi:hypothetical protein
VYVSAGNNGYNGGRPVYQITLDRKGQRVYDKGSNMELKEQAMSRPRKTLIDPERWYGIMEIVDEGLFPWCKTVKSVRKWIQIDRAGKNKLKATIVGEGTNTRYHIKGSNIIVFLANMEDGTYAQ